MGTLEDKAREFGGRVEPNGSILVPAESLAQFLEAAQNAVIPVPYIECLFKSNGGTRPCMMLSASPGEFTDHGAFLAFAQDAASRALAEASVDKSTAFFEVGP